MPTLEEITEEPPRRSFMKRISRLTLGTLAATKFSPKPVSAQRRISYLDAVLDTSKRQAWIDQVVAGKIPDYVISVDYAPPEVLRELWIKFGYRPPRGGTFAALIPFILNKSGELMPATYDRLGKGAKSKIFVQPPAFYDLYQHNPNLEKRYLKPELYIDSEIIITNVIINGQFTMAEHFSKGVPGYSLESFKDANGKFNYQLYNKVVELLGYSSEYNGLLANPRIRTSMYLQFYASGVTDLGRAIYGEFYRPELVGNMDKTFIEKLRNDLNPLKFFPRQRSIQRT